MKQIKDNPDPIAVIIGAVISIVSILGIPEALGLDTNQVGIIGGGLIAMAGAIRTLTLSRAKRKANQE